MRQLLARAGFRVRGNRADCFHCKGSSRGTVSFNRLVAFCHRCKWSANARQLAHKVGCTVPTETPEHRLARQRVERFHQWLWKRYTKLGYIERRLARCAEWAKAALNYFPGMDSAWAALAGWYHERRALSAFFELAECKAGRRAMFAEWVKANG